ncbi:MAG: class I SAM-dependent methyltransferase [Candidatus Theseobacter exili]|nr:class I SAM-dependent methyltransferase [Candidatus Theseobacter exili]
MDNISLDRAANEPWYISSRSSQIDRFGKAMQLIDLHCPVLKKVIDVGCAEGQFSHNLSKNAEKVTGIDINPDRIEHDRSKYGSVDNLEFFQGDFLKLDIPDNEVDLLAALEVFYYFDPEQQNAFLQKATKVVKKGGFILLSINVFRRSKFTESYIIKLLNVDFNVVEIIPVYRNFYYYFELKIIRFLDELNYLSKLRIFSPNILSLKKKFYPGIWNRILLRPSVSLDRIIIPALRWFSLKIIESKLLYKLVTEVTRMISPEAGKSQVLIIAKNDKGPS